MTTTRLTFSQSQGLEPLPAPLEPKQISGELRAKLWEIVHASLKSSLETQFMGPPHIKGQWRAILSDHFVDIQHEYIDDYNEKFGVNVAVVREIIEEGSYNKIFDFLTYVLRHPQKPRKFEQAIQYALRKSRAAYDLIDGDTIVPISNIEELNAIQQAISKTKNGKLAGAHQHLRNAAKYLQDEKDADSVRESIHAVESVARIIDPTGAKTLGPAISALERKGHINAQLKSAFEKLYAFTNTEEGIRHPMLDNPDAKVDETDARFMLGACASFVSYLISKGIEAKLIVR